MEKDQWHFEHDEFDCPKCSTSKKAYLINFYMGTYKGEDAHKYECPHCGYVEIKTMTELMKEQSD